MSTGCSNVGGPERVPAIPCDTSAPDAAAPLEGDLVPLPEALRLLQSDDVGAQLAAMAILDGRQQRHVAKRLRAAEERAQQAADDAQLAAQRTKAEKARNAAWVGGFSQCASGAAGIASGGALGAGGSKAEAASRRWDGIGKSTEGGGKIAGAQLQADADGAAVEATHQEQIAGRHKRAGDDARDQADDAKRTIDKALDFYKEYIQAKSESQRAALMRT